MGIDIAERQASDDGAGDATDWEKWQAELNGSADTGNAFMAVGRNALRTVLDLGAGLVPDRFTSRNQLSRPIGRSALFPDLGNPNLN